MFLVPINRSASGWVRNFDHLFDESFDRFFSGVASSAAWARNPSLDVAESEQAYTVTIELPGVAKDNVQVSIEGRRVSIEAKSANGERKDGDRVLLRERAASSYARSFVLPAELDDARSNAKLEHGVLTLELAKRQATPATKITVN